MSLMNFWCGNISLRGFVATAAISSVFLFAACGGDSGANAPSDNGASDSEKNQSSSSFQRHSSSSQKSSSSSSLEFVSSSSKLISSSSSSQKAKSSSSVILSGDSHEESSSALSSSSWSSEGTIGSSSSSEKEPSSSSSVELNCSALLEGETGWSWNVPKECRFNPDIAYGTMIDSRDGQTYKTVKIGDQTWMAENLNFDPGQGGSGDTKYDLSWCYGDEPKNCDVAGRLYTWAAAIDSVKLATDADNPQDCGFDKAWNCTLPATVQGICPNGWHLPTETEWKTLFTEVGGELEAGKILKAQTGWNGTDSVGFSALPAGGRDNGGQFGADGNFAYFWCSNSAGPYYASYMSLDYTEYAGLEPGLKDTAFSVRCLKD